MNKKLMKLVYNKINSTQDFTKAYIQATIYKLMDQISNLLCLNLNLEYISSKSIQLDLNPHI